MSKRNVSDLNILIELIKKSMNIEHPCYLTFHYDVINIICNYLLKGKVSFALTLEAPKGRNSISPPLSILKLFRMEILANNWLEVVIEMAFFSSGIFMST